MNVLELTKKLISIDSTDPGNYENSIAEFIKSVILPELSLINGNFKEGQITNKRPILMFEIPGKETSPALIILCHMDTVPAGKDWSMNPFSPVEKNGKIYGRGSCDMKSGTACAINAFIDAIDKIKQGASLKKTIRLIFTSDEEADMLGSIQVVKNGWIDKNDLVMDTEPTDGEIQTAHKGRYWFSVTVHGKAAHASEPTTGADAISGMAYLIIKARDEINSLKEDNFTGKSTITFGTIQGGTQLYQVPAECSASVDMRLVPPYQGIDGEKILLEAAKYARKFIPGIRCEISSTGSKPSIPHNSDSEILCLLRDSVYKVTGKEPKITAFPGYTDSAIIAGMNGNKNTLSFGPGSLSQAHKADEYVEVESIENCYAIYEDLLLKMFQ